MDGTKPWLDNLVPIDESAVESLNGLAGTDTVDAEGDTYEGGWLSYLIPAAITGVIVFAITKFAQKKVS